MSNAPTFHEPPLCFDGQVYPLRALPLDMAVRLAARCQRAPNMGEALAAAAELAEAIGWPPAYLEQPGPVVVQAVKGLLTRIRLATAAVPLDDFAEIRSAGGAAESGAAESVEAFGEEVRRCFPGDDEIRAAVDLLQARWRIAEPAELLGELRWVGERLQALMALEVAGRQVEAATARGSLRASLLSGRIG